MRYGLLGLLLDESQLTMGKPLFQNLCFANHQGPNTPTPESITLQRKKLQETRKLQRALKQECARNDAILTQLRAMLSDAQSAGNKATGAEQQGSAEQELPNLSFLTSDPAAKMLNVGRNDSLTTNTTFILSQLPALRAVLERLRPKLNTLPKTALVDSEKRDERREYIDSRIRMHLERSGEPSMSDAGAVVAGRKVAGAESQALEAVASILND
jgi:kinetochore protein Mis12/MTW1